MEELRVLYGQSNARLAGLRTTYKSSHPVFEAAASEVEQLEVQIQTEAARVVTQLRVAHEVEENNLRIAEANLERLRQQIEQSDRQKVELRQLESRAEASREVLERFLKRSEETGELQKVQRPEAKIISLALPPTQPAWPNPRILLPLSLLLGLTGGCIVAVGLGFPSRSLRRNPVASTGLANAVVPN